MICPVHCTQLLVANEINISTMLYRCEYSRLGQARIHMLLIIDYGEDKIIEVKES